MVTLNILIIDDEEYKSQHIKNAITYEHIIYSFSKNYKDSIDKLSKNKYDLVFLDLNLPLDESSEPNKETGVLILDELSTNEELIQPNNILCLTQFENLKELNQDNYSEVSTILFSSETNKWKDAINRKIEAILKSKSNEKITIYCEGQNSTVLNKLNHTYNFIGLNNSRDIFLEVVKNISICIRDKDFISKDEKNKLTTKFNKYIILKYYCFENYLFHPLNITEAYQNIPIKEYIEDILKQKNKKIFYIIQDYKIARKSYTEFTNTTYKINISNDFDREIIESLISDDFEVFYQYFDMAGKNDKGHSKSYCKTFLNNYNVKTHNLIKTEWFKKNFIEMIDENIKKVHN